MESAKELGAASDARSAEQLSTPELVREIAAKATLLVQKELELARVELKEDIASELATIKAFAAAAVAAITTVNLMLVAVVLALAAYVRPWVAALVIAGVTLAITLAAAILGWRTHVSHPLAKTRRTLQEDAQWVKEEIR